MKISSLLYLFFCLILINIPATGNAQIITTVAGCGIGDDSAATRAELYGPVGVAIDSSGNTYVVDESSYRVRRIDPAGIITTFAGSGMIGNSGDGGPATDAQVGTLYGVAADRHGNIYFVDNTFNCIRKVNAAGVISTIAGTGTAGFGGDGGPATAATLNNPIDIVVDTAGNVIFTDWLNSRVRKINTAGIISTIVGDGSVGSTGNGGPATASELGRPFRVTLDNKGNLYVAEVVYQCICKVDTAGIITVIGGTGAYSLGTDGDGGPATAATMTSPCGLAVDTSGNLYFSDIGNYRIRRINMNTGIISNYAANGIAGYGGDGGPATVAQIQDPEGLACDKFGNLLICDPSNNLIRKTSTAGIMSTFAGQTGSFGDGIAATAAELNYPENLVTDAAGNIYIADIGGNRVRMINTSGIISTIAGNGVGGFSGDGGPAIAAGLQGPSALAFDRAGNLYICDQDNQRVRMVNTSGIITTIAGSGTAGYSGDGGAAISAELHYPTGVVVDTAGNVYICDNNNQCIRKVDPSGIITTVVGSGVAGYSGDGGPASDAQLGYPSDVALDGNGNLYVCDGGNSCIRMVSTSGIITTIAGSGTAGFSGDGGPAAGAQLYYPYGMKVDNAGNIFIADHGNNRIRLVTTDGMISTIAGNGAGGFSGDDGPAVTAMLNFPTGVALDNSGNLFVADAGNDRIRKVTIAYLSASSPDKTHGWQVTAYPNPATNDITITGAANTEITMYDVVGKEILKRAVTGNKETIDIADLASGVYLLQAVSSNGDRKNIKVIKE